MKENDQLKVIQDYVNLLGKTYIILLSSLDEFFGATLSTNEKVVLQILDETPISIKEVSMRTGLALSTLTNVLDKMEEKRLVKRRHSQTDRRMVKIELDVAGRRLQSRFNNLINQLSATLLKSLTQEDREQFTSALEKTEFFLSVDSNDFQNGLSSLIEPLQITLARQFKKKGL
jgi:DNA-binding MarR family transcriptional regulator